MNQSLVSGIDGFLQRYGWQFVKTAKDIWQTGFSFYLADQEFKLPLRIISQDTFISFQVQPLMVCEWDVEADPELLNALLEWNHTNYLVRLGIDEAGDFVLNMDILRIRCDYEVFSTALGILGYYGEYYYNELSRILNLTCQQSILNKI